MGGLRAAFLPPLDCFNTCTAQPGIVARMFHQALWHKNINLALWPGSISLALWPGSINPAMWPGRSNLALLAWML